MARIVLSAWLFRYPLGGTMSENLHYLLGFRQLGHDVYVVEKADYPQACFDPARGVMSDDCSYAVATVGALLHRLGFAERWCFVDYKSQYHGLSRSAVEPVLRSADLLLDRGHGSWLEEAQETGLRVLIDGEPAFTQIRMEKRLQAGEALPVYDHYYTHGLNVGTPASTAPTAGLPWRHLLPPVVVDYFLTTPPPERAPFTTVMNWKSHAPVTFDGVTYGQKDIEFEKFIDLPRRSMVPMEIAVAGPVPKQRLEQAGWQLADAHRVTKSLESFLHYLGHSAGEFAVAKNVFVAHRTGWFSERSSAYLASGRPVVLQDTGFSDHLPVGEGLFAVETVEEAAEVMSQLAGDSRRQCRLARQTAEGHLDARRVLAGFLTELGL